MATNDKATRSMGKALVSKGDVIVVESFLQDRPIPFVDVEQQEAELRVGAKSEFQFDLTIGSSKSRKDFLVTGPSYGDVKWPDPPTLDDPNADNPNDVVINTELKETNREIEQVRVEGSDGVSWVDIQRIKSITFQLPDRAGPTGTISEYWTLKLNWDSPVINGVDTSQINLKPGDTIVDVENA
jgi:hypothetical protein